MPTETESTTRAPEPESTTEPEQTPDLFPYEDGAERVGTSLPVASARGVLRSSDDRARTDGAVGSTACPDCGAETIDGAGVFACLDCEWTGTLR